MWKKYTFVTWGYRIHEATDMPVNVFDSCEYKVMFDLYHEIYKLMFDLYHEIYKLMFDLCH